MNQTTEDVIEFLNFPESDFGTTPLDAELAQDPALLRERVAGLLETPWASSDSRVAAEKLRGRLDEAEWDIICREMQERLTLTAGFFDPVARNISQATK